MSNMSYCRFENTLSDLQDCAGTAYGHLHTTGGDVRTWRSYSGAQRVARAYEPL